jgi:hypothetical protein
MAKVGKKTLVAVTQTMLTFSINRAAENLLGSGGRLHAARISFANFYDRQRQSI